MSTNLTGQDVDVRMGDLNIVFESMSLSIEDGRVASFSRGVPNGDLGGKYSAGGEISVDTTNLLLFIEAAKNVGAFNRLPKFDGIFNASTDDVELNECIRPRTKSKSQPEEVSASRIVVNERNGCATCCNIRTVTIILLRLCCGSVAHSGCINDRRADL